jgi:hypothetical protein
MAAERARSDLPCLFVIVQASHAMLHIGCHDESGRGAISEVGQLLGHLLLCEASVLRSTAFRVSQFVANSSLWCPRPSNSVLFSQRVLRAVLLANCT